MLTKEFSRSSPSAALPFLGVRFAIRHRRPADRAAPTPAVQTKASQAEMTPAKALERLKEGNARFAEGRGVPRNLPAKVAATAAGQYPFAAIVSCMDSRAPDRDRLRSGDRRRLQPARGGQRRRPEFSRQPRVRGEGGGRALLVVLGHSQCGAVKGAIDGVKMGNLTGLLAEIQPAIDGAGPKKSSKDAAYVARVAEGNVRVAMKEIHEKSPILAGGDPLGGGRAGRRDVRPRERARHLLRGLNRREDLVGVAVGLDLRPHAGDLALLVDQVRHAVDAHELPPVHRLLAPDAVVLHDLLVRVGEQAKRQVELLGELLVRLLVVHRDAEHLDLALAELREAVPERAGLDRAAGRVVLRDRSRGRPCGP